MNQITHSKSNQIIQFLTHQIGELDETDICLAQPM